MILLPIADAIDPDDEKGDESGRIYFLVCRLDG